MSIPLWWKLLNSISRLWWQFSFSNCCGSPFVFWDIILRVLDWLALARLALCLMRWNAAKFVSASHWCWYAGEASSGDLTVYVATNEEIWLIWLVPPYTSWLTLSKGSLPSCAALAPSLLLLLLLLLCWFVVVCWWCAWVASRAHLSTYGEYKNGV